MRLTEALVHLLLQYIGYGFQVSAYNTYPHQGLFELITDNPLKLSCKKIHQKPRYIRYILTQNTASNYDTVPFTKIISIYPPYFQKKSLPMKIIINLIMEFKQL